MSDPVNRSRFIVTVKTRDDLTAYFPYDHFDEAEAYFQKLRQKKFKPRIKQLDESFLARIRQTGYPVLNMTFGTEQEAIDFQNEVKAQRSRGLFIDYTKARQVTLAELLVRYLHEELGHLKSKDIIAYKIEGWLQDSGPLGVELLKAYREDLASQNKKVRAAAFQMRDSSTALLWLHKKLAEVTTVDIEDYIKERLEAVAPSTVDRDIDILKAIFKVITTVWDYNLIKNPMTAVRRPRYFNERDRRISSSEEEKLLSALAQMDLERCLEPVLSEMADDYVAGQHFGSLSARKKVMAVVRSELREKAIEATDVVPYLQAFYYFQVLTGARRGETMSLTWDRIDFTAGTAYLPETKNGRARKLSLRQSLLDILADLPQDTEKVFDVGIDYLVKNWKRACDSAGIDDLHIHDCRHEAISRLAESGSFSISDLQQFSGHRDVRMLMRYSHLCASRLAKKINECFNDKGQHRIHKGRKLLRKGATISLTEVLAYEDTPTALDSQPVSTLQPASKEGIELKDTAKIYQFPSRQAA
ncbi:MAG: site-specific integrase [Rhodoferax sp.]|nr:MAG: site-specific integrase [Rhodoferax sp.]